MVINVSVIPSTTKIDEYWYPVTKVYFDNRFQSGQQYDIRHDEESQARATANRFAQDELERIRQTVSQTINPSSWTQKRGG